jgi:hypothetical protein
LELSQKGGILIKVIVKITIMLMSFGGAFLPIESSFLMFG